jgi:hypothetical protein
MTLTSSFSPTPPGSITLSFPPTPLASLSISFSPSPTPSAFTHAQIVVSLGGAPGDQLSAQNSLAVSADGSFVVAGAYRKDSGAGTVYVWHFDGVSWTLQASLRPPGITANNFFGYTVSISSNGDTIIAGAYGQSVGNFMDYGSNPFAFLSGAGNIY